MLHHNILATTHGKCSCIGNTSWDGRHGWVHHLSFSFVSQTAYSQTLEKHHTWAKSFTLNIESPCLFSKLSHLFKTLSGLPHIVWCKRDPNWWHLRNEWWYLHPMWRQRNITTCWRWRRVHCAKCGGIFLWFEPFFTSSKVYITMMWSVQLSWLGGVSSKVQFTFLLQLQEIGNEITKLWSWKIILTWIDKSHIFLFMLEGKRQHRGSDGGRGMGQETHFRSYGSGNLTELVCNPHSLAHI